MRVGQCWTAGKAPNGAGRLASDDVAGENDARTTGLAAPESSPSPSS
jgi:hypothetical protein